MRTGSQCDKLLRHMACGGTVTSMEAFKRFGITSLHRRLAELRERGHRVRGYDTLTKSGARIKTYFLDPAGRRSKAGV